MGHKKHPKTSGQDWLVLSIVSFNGSGYADREDAEAYIASYRAYKQMRKEDEAVKLVDFHNELALMTADDLLEKSFIDTRPSDKNLIKFAKYYPPAQNWVNNAVLF